MEKSDRNNGRKERWEELIEDRGQRIEREKKGGKREYEARYRLMEGGGQNRNE